MKTDAARNACTALTLTEYDKHSGSFSIFRNHSLRHRVLIPIPRLINFGLISADFKDGGYVNKFNEVSNLSQASVLLKNRTVY